VCVCVCTHTCLLLRAFALVHAISSDYFKGTLVLASDSGFQQNREKGSIIHKQKRVMHVHQVREHRLKDVCRYEFQRANMSPKVRCKALEDKQSQSVDC